MLSKVTSNLSESVSLSRSGSVTAPRPSSPSPDRAHSALSTKMAPARPSGRPARDVTAPPRPRRARARGRPRSRSARPLPPSVPPGAVPVPLPGCAQEDMAALGRVSRLLLGAAAAAPRSPLARGIAAAAAHEEGGGNGALRGEGGAGASAALPLRAGALR